MKNKILLVEDSTPFRNFLTRVLEKHDFDVVSAQNYQQAQALLASETCFFCTVLDFCLPDAPDGEVIDLAIKSKQRSVVVSATYRQAERDKFIEKGVLDYLLKDTDSVVDELVSLLRRLKKNHQHHALLVDDSRLIQKQISARLEHQYIRTTVANDGEEALDKIKQNPDITFVITDYGMPNLDGISLVKEIRKTSKRNALPILGLSGMNDSALTARFLKAGANDFLSLPFDQEELNCRIHNLLSMKEANDALFLMANQDSLTGLWNRRYLFSSMGQSFIPHFLAVIDIDHFKKINDSQGHACGDLVIKNIAQMIVMHFDSTHVYRIGGEEFCILYEGTYEDFVTHLEVMRESIAFHEFTYNDTQMTVTVSIGATYCFGDVDEKLLVADKNLYKAKEKGRNNLVHDESDAYSL